jgi:hypothetical protein
LPPDFFLDFFVLFFFAGTFAPSARASDKPIAIACLRLLTFLPERPLRNVPFLRSRIALATFFDAFLLYFLAMRCSPFACRLERGSTFHANETCMHDDECRKARESAANDQ